MIKRIAAMLLAAALLLGASACGTMGHSGGLRIVTTVFPAYDWVRAILGEDTNAELTWLQDGGVDLHSYQATAADLAKIAECDVFIYVGGESDAWAEEALKQATNGSMVVIDLMEALGTAVNLAEGESEDGGTEYDEHIWLSLQNAKILTAYIAAVLGALDRKNAETYAENASAYENELLLLDASYLAAVRAAGVKTLVFGDRFPFRYLMEDYGLDWYAAFPGCSAETEASFETILTLAGKVDELSLPAVIAVKGSDGSVAGTVAENAASAPAVLWLDSMQSVTRSDAEAGETYLSAMEENLTVLRQALGA